MHWLELLIACGVVACSLIGVLLVALTLPGIWFMVLVAGLAQWWSIAHASGGAGAAGAGLAVAGATVTSGGAAPEMMFSWWTLGTAAGLAVVGEMLEMFASAVGSSKAGGTRRGAIGSVIGGILGAIIGSFAIPIPVLGTIVGAALGAGAGALLLERHGGQKTWGEASKVGAGAAAGRLAATIAKLGIACVTAVVLSVGAFT